jgi:hypothetical protein
MLGLVLCPTLLRAQGEPPSAEEVAAFVKRLETALAPGAEAKTAVVTLREARRMVHDDVIRLIDTKGLSHGDGEVRTGAVEALARMEHSAALDALHSALKRDKKKLAEDPPRHVILLRAIARHGAERSVPLLVEDLFQSNDRTVVTARILGLGNIRVRAAVDELIRMMRSATPARVADFMPELRSSLFMLTGVDKGGDQELWINWYGDAKEKLVIEPDPPATVPPEIRRPWTAFWGPELMKNKLRRGPGK